MVLDRKKVGNPGFKFLVRFEMLYSPLNSNIFGILIIMAGRCVPQPQPVLRVATPLPLWSFLIKCILYCGQAFLARSLSKRSIDCIVTH